MPYLILFVLTAGLFWFFGSRYKTHSNSKQSDQATHRLHDLSRVANLDFGKSWLMHGEETQLYWKLINHIKEHHQSQSLSVFAQVAMGEFIWCKTPSSYPMIASKRVDFLIAQKQSVQAKDKRSFEVYSPIAVIEFQGRHHHKSNTSFERDALKKTVCTKAGIAWIEFTDNYDETNFQLLSKELNGVIQHEKSH